MGLYVEEYNERRLHSALGYLTPKDMLEGRQQAIFDERDRKLEEARERRAQNRAKQREKRSEAPSASTTTSYTTDTQPKDRALHLFLRSLIGQRHLASWASSLDEVFVATAAKRWKALTFASTVWRRWLRSLPSGAVQLKCAAGASSYALLESESSERAAALASGN